MAHPRPAQPGDPRRYGQRPSPCLISRAHQHLHLHPARCGQHQRHQQRQVLDHRAAGQHARVPGQLRERRPRQDHRPVHHVVGQPRLRGQRDPPGDHHAAVRQIHHRRQQRMPARRIQPRARSPRPAPRSQPVPLALEGVPRQLRPRRGAGRACQPRPPGGPGRRRGLREPLRPAVIPAQRPGTARGCPPSSRHSGTGRSAPDPAPPRRTRRARRRPAPGPPHRTAPPAQAVIPSTRHPAPAVQAAGLPGITRRPAGSAEPRRHPRRPAARSPRAPSTCAEWKA